MQEFSIFNQFIKSFATKNTISSILGLYLAGPITGASKPPIDPRMESSKNIQAFLNQLEREVITNSTLATLMPIKETVEVLNFSRNIIDQYTINPEILIKHGTIGYLFPNLSHNIVMYIESIKSDRLIDLEYIDYEIQAINKTVYIFNGLKNAKKSLNKLSSLFNEEKMTANDSPMNVFSTFKEAIMSNYTELNELMDNYGEGSENEKTFNFSNTSSTNIVTDEMFDFIAKDYSFFNTNYEIIDNCMPLESATTSIITGPSNHCKSIFMVNICKRVIEHNTSAFNRYEPSENKNDVVLFITLEDDIYKLTRRMMSIFGNHPPSEVKTIVKGCNTLAVSEQNNLGKITEASSELIKNIISELLNNSIVNITTGSAELIIQHGTENTFCCNDITKKINSLAKNGKIVKALFVDYIDVMVPNDHLINYIPDDYKAQGQILHELRLVGRNNNIPVMTVTQNNKLTEDITVELSNSLIGDSYKKIRYSDNILMIRQRPDISIEDDVMLTDMKNMTHINRDDAEQRDLVFLRNDLVPLECKVTKSKDNERDVKLFHIFNKLNLSIYTDWAHLKHDWKLQNDNAGFYENIKDNLLKSTETHTIPNSNFQTPSPTIASDAEAFLYDDIV